MPKAVETPRSSINRRWLSTAVENGVESDPSLQTAVFGCRAHREILIEPRGAALVLSPADPRGNGAAASVEHTIEFNAESLWDDVAARLQGALNETTFQTWFGDVEGDELDADTFILAVPNDFTREWIESHFLELIRAAVKDATGSERRVHLRVDHTEAAVPVAVGAGAGPPGPLAPRTLVPPPLPRPDAAGIN